MKTERIVGYLFEISLTHQAVHHPQNRSARPIRPGYHLVEAYLLSAISHQKLHNRLQYSHGITPDMP
jgi:hypothetical protein